MEGRDYLDDMLYRAMPRLDQAMQECQVREQAFSCSRTRHSCPA